MTALARLEPRHLTRPVAILIGLSGQLYMTILIAMLVGKFLAGNERP